MNEDNIREKTDLELEREELNLLVKQGVRFSVTHKIRRRKKGVKGFFQRPEVVTVKEDFEIQEPTLSVLDRLSAIWVEMGLDEKRLTAGGTETLAEAKRIAKDNAARMARIIAIAVLGEDYHVTEVCAGGRVKKYNDDKELDRLTALFFHTKLVGLSEAVTSVSNLGDFISSMRLMSGARTTQPRTERIE
mgnify:CR=1 FL=1